MELTWRESDAKGMQEHNMRRATLESSEPLSVLPVYMD